MSFLSEEQIENIVLEYLEENIYNYAIMIDGSWGSGKTYFINETLIPYLNNKTKRKSIYISLYGINEIEQISNSIITTLFERKFGKGKKFIPLANVGYKIVAEAIGSLVGSETLANGNFNNTISPFMNYEKFCFIFDDLERCSMPINEVLGYINHFIEQNSAKVILVANEKEIGSSENQRNLEVKYLLSTNEKIDWPPLEIAPEIKAFGLKTEHKEKIDLVELDRRCRYLFHDDLQYSQIKEKLIGKVIYFQPDLNQVVPKVIIKCLDNEAEDIASSLIEIIKEIMRNQKHYNIRTLQFSLMFFRKIVNLLEREQISKDIKNLVLEDVLVSIIKVSIYYKKGGKQYNWDENGEYGTICLGEPLNYNNYLRSFKFIHDYIFWSDYNNERIIKVLKDYAIYREREAHLDPITKLSDYWEMEDCVVEEEVKKMFENFKSNKYNGNSYQSIISTLYKLKSIGIEPVKIQNFIEIMETNIKNGESIITMQESDISTENLYYNEYINCLKKLKGLSSDSGDKSFINELSNIFDFENEWGKAFYKLCYNNAKKFISEKKFFKFINIDKCIKRIMISPVIELSSFRRGILCVYDFSNLKDYFYDDGENLFNFKEKLTNCGNIESKVKKYNIELLLGNIEEFLIKLEYKPNK